MNRYECSNFDSCETHGTPHRLSLRAAPLSLLIVRRLWSARLRVKWPIPLRQCGP